MYHRHKLLDLIDLAALTMATETKNKSTDRSTKSNLPERIAVLQSNIFKQLPISVNSCGTDTISMILQHRYFAVRNQGTIAKFL
jgi:hypothetical protein